MNHTFKKILVAASASAVLLSATVAYAKDTRAEQLRENVKERAQQTAERIKEARENAEEKIKEKREQVKEHITKIKDQRKQQAADKIIKQLDRVNKVWTDHFSKVLERLDAVVQKIKTRAEKALANGRDTSAVTVAIRKAETAIATARAAVTAQAQKTYTLDASMVSGATTQEDQSSLVANLREQFKALKDQLHKDLTGLRDGAMKDAKTAVADAIKSLSQVPGVDREPAANSTNP